MSSLILKTAPTKKLFTVQELKDHLRIAVSMQADQDMLNAYQDAATEWIQGLAGISVMKQTWTLKADQFPCNYGYGRRNHFLGEPLLFPRGPVISIDTFTYKDSNGNDVDFNNTANWQDALSEKPPALYPPYGGFFPTARAMPGALAIDFTCGMSGSSDDASKVDNDVKLAVRFLVAHWFENREPVPVNLTPAKIPYALEAMIWSTRKGYRFDWQEYYSRRFH